MNQTHRLERQAALRAHAATQPGCTPYDNPRPVRVPNRFDGQTIQDCLEGLCKHIGTDRWPKAEAEDRLLINERTVRLDTRVKAGMIITYIVPQMVEPAINPEITLVFEDEHLLVVNKPAPLPVHPCGRYNLNTLLRFFEALWPDMVLRPAHRLDAATTGIMVFTKSRQAASLVQTQFAKRTVEKDYLVKAQGIPQKPHFVVDAPITKKPTDLGKREISDAGYPARTDFELLQELPNDQSLLRARPYSGRTNQIRIHLESVGLPIEGDTAYSGAPTTESSLVPDDSALRLHAWRLGFKHPGTGDKFVVESPLPPWAEELGVLGTGG